MARRLSSSGLAACVLVATALFGATAGTAARQATTVSVDYATSFGNFGRDAYVYVAIEKGYFEQAGFDVKVTTGHRARSTTSSSSPPGRLDYAPVDIGALMVTRANEGLPVRTVARRPPEHDVGGVHARQENVTTPKALEGKTLADSPASTVRVLFPLYAKKAGIDAVEGDVARRGAAGAARAARREAGGRDRPVQRRASRSSSKAAGGKPIRSFKYSKVLPGLLGIGIVASDEKIRSNPGEVRAFTRALLRGLRYAIDNPGEAGYILKKYQPLADPIVAAQELRIMKFFVQNRAHPPEGQRASGTSTSRSSTRRRA